LNILIAQDILLAPMLTLFQFLGNNKFSVSKIIGPLSLSVMIFLILKTLRNRRLLTSVALKFDKDLDDDHDLQIFSGAAICLCFGVVAEINSINSGRAAGSCNYIEHEIC
jgi:CPA2 family monovalent cation:H+ antiporter-2